MLNFTLDTVVLLTIGLTGWYAPDEELLPKAVAGAGQKSSKPNRDCCEGTSGLLTRNQDGNRSCVN